MLEDSIWYLVNVSSYKVNVHLYGGIVVSLSTKWDTYLVLSGLSIGDKYTVPQCSVGTIFTQASGLSVPCLILRKNDGHRRI